MFYDDDADLSLLDGKTVAIIGYGSQGHAHARNLKDSGVNVIVGLRDGSKSVAQAQSHGLEVVSPSEAASRGDVVMLLVPDERHKEIYESEVVDGLAEGNLLLFGHGFSVLYNEVEPPSFVDVGLAAPKGPATSSAASTKRARASPASSRSTRTRRATRRPSPSPTPRASAAPAAASSRPPSKEETETDLFGEQAVLCGGASALVQAGFETLVEAGYNPEMAYFECLHELKLIVDLMYEKGLAGMRYSISNTAEYGDLTRGPRVVDADTKARMKAILGEIQDGTFAREFIAEYRAGNENFDRMRDEQSKIQLESVGKELRSKMAWIDGEFHE